LTSRSIVDDRELALICKRYAAFDLASLTHGTVRDYIDSLDHIPRLARIQGDLKDLQRPWMLKAILGNVPRGGRLVEIGAGEPLLAHILHRAGYQVTVVDPYDGSGRGPTDLERYRRDFPGIEFVVDRFGPGLNALAANSIHCCYSVSVLEHIALDDIDGVFRETRRIAVRDGHCIHAIDHVMLGWGDEYHLEMLSRVATASDLNVSNVHEMLQRAGADPETYFLSANAHNLWRGGAAYEQFPMRRCISAQFFTKVQQG
jgi:hypothetical protein